MPIVLALGSMGLTGELLPFVHSTDNANRTVLAESKKLFGDYGQPGTIEMFSYRKPETLAPVGRGIDLTRCGLYAYDSGEIQYDIFDRSFINSEYLSEGYFNVPTVTSTTTSVLTGTLESINSRYSVNVSGGAFAQASEPFCEAQMAVRAGFSTYSSMHKSETHLIYNLKSISHFFEYELPSPTANRMRFVGNLSADFLEDLQNAVTASNRGGGEYAYYALFEKYGTHVLWKAGFGGACDIVYSAHSREVKLDESVRSLVSTKLNATAENVSVGVYSNFDLSKEISKQNAAISQRVDTKFVGGTVNDLAMSFNETAHVAKNWIKTIKDNPVVLTYKKAEPIWKFLPNEYSSYVSAIQSAFSSYQESQSGKYMDDARRLICSDNQLSDKYTYLNEDQYKEFGDYWDQRKDQVFDVTFNNSNFYDLKKLRAAGFKTVDIAPSFGLEQIRDGTKVNVEIFYGKGFEQKRSTPEIDISDGEYHIEEIEDLIVSVNISEFINNPKLRFKFATNNKKGQFLYWDERGAKLNNLKFVITYYK